MSVENIVVDVEINNSIAPDIEQSIVATIDNNINVIKDDTDDLDVTINRKEYVITGDEIYIPKRYEDAPTWLQNMIDQVVEYSIGAKVSDMNQVVYSLNQMIEAMEVSKNTYEMSVISSNDIDTRINTAITTLNSNMNDADATILSVANTKTTPEEAEAIMINAVRAELESTEAGTIGAAVATLSTAIANEEEARSTSVETLYSTMEGEFEATARAFNTINTYVGLDEVGASTGTGLSGYLESSTGIIGGADSKVVNNVYVDALGNAKSKFEYGSTVSVNGATHTAGFGLSNSTGTDIGSEFWINASKFKFTNNNKTGSKSPFTIDATGTVPEITFNGKVAFTNVTGYTPTDGSSSNMIKNSEFETGISPWALGWNQNGSTIDNFGLSENIHTADWIITGSTGSLTLHQSGRNTSTENDDIGIDIYPQGFWDYTKGYAVEAGKTYEFSVYVATHRCKAKIGMYFFNSSGVPVGSSGIDYVTPLDGGKTIDGYKRIHTRATTPTGSATALLFVRKKNTDAGQADSWIWIDRPFFGKVDTNSVAPIHYIASDGSLANNNTLAQKLGYLSYADMVAAATAGQTIINGGYVNTSLLQANSIVASKINTVGLIADNISSNAIISNNIYGSYIEGANIVGAIINGARINGAVIKASYLDLDGELEVLTNYHISVAMYNESASIYSDAVFISADNEYRIPSISNVTSLLKEVGNSNSPFVSAGNYTLSSGIYSYASANIGTNMKAVKPRPAIINIGSSPHSSIPENYLYSAVFATLNSGSGYFRFYIGNLLILSVVKSGSSVSYSGLAGSGSIASPEYDNTNTVNLSYGVMTFSIKRKTFYGDRIYVTYGGATNLQIIDDWSSGQIRVEANSQTQDGFNSLVGFRLPAITINNMI